MKRLLEFFRDEQGAVSLEYAMIGAGLSILIITGATSIGTAIDGLFFGPVGAALAPVASP